MVEMFSHCANCMIFPTIGDDALNYVSVNFGEQEFVFDGYGRVTQPYVIFYLIDHIKQSQKTALGFLKKHVEARQIEQNTSDLKADSHSVIPNKIVYSKDSNGNDIYSVNSDTAIGTQYREIPPQQFGYDIDGQPTYFIEFNAEDLSRAEIDLYSEFSPSESEFDEDMDEDEFY